MKNSFDKELDDGFVSYPFQLRPDLWVFLKLPPSLTHDEVERLSAFLELLSVNSSAPKAPDVEPAR